MARGCSPLALVRLSAWGAGRGVCQMMTQLREQATLSEQLAQLEGYALTMERSLLGLAHTEHPKARDVGCDPRLLYRALLQAHCKARVCVEAVETRVAHASALETSAALMRLQAAWQQVDAALGDYLRQGQPARVSLTTLRAFSFEGQTLFATAVREFRCAYQREQQALWARALWELLGYFVVQLTSAGLLIGRLWRRYGAPARWLRNALRQPNYANPYAARLQHTDWGELYQQLRFQERRLRSAEQFMRDLATGRMPAPIPPTDAADPLARSSQWLLQRLERASARHERASWPSGYPSALRARLRQLTISVMLPRKTQPRRICRHARICS